MTEQNKLLDDYLSSLTELERKAYNIAISQLDTSFSLEKSVGFLKWKKEQNKTD
jgi:hypothetical protein